MILDTVLLFALPASGKSELRKYMEHLDPQKCINEMHIGPTIQLDDYPYVHLMHRIDDELYAHGYQYVFYHGPTRPFQDGFTWGMLIELLNEDYADLLAQKTHEVSSAGQWMMDRFDAARKKVGLLPVLEQVPYKIRCQVADAIEEECQTELQNKNKICTTPKEGKTVIIEAARGGQNGSAYPLTPPQGYEYALSVLSNDILDRAGILYVWVTPEDSRRKNIERGKPDGQGSILFHSVPMEVMLGQYGCDDMNYLLEQSSKSDCVEVNKIIAEGDGYVTKTWHLPVGRFDNRDDLTSFIRKDPKNWEDKEVNAIHTELTRALNILASK